MTSPAATAVIDAEDVRVQLAAHPVKARRGAAGIAHRAKQGRALAHGLQPDVAATVGELTSGAFVIHDAPPTALLVRLVDLGPGECAWPVDGSGAAARFCGRAVDPEAAGTLRERYCAHHGPKASTAAPMPLKSFLPWRNAR
jgi:hypothetical protein